MDKVIPAALRENVFVYLDGLLVCSPTFEAHIDMFPSLAPLNRSGGSWE